MIPILALASAMLAVAVEPPAEQYLVLATSKTSTMEKEMNDAASAGYRFHSVMGGETAGGNEVVVVMARNDESGEARTYRLLATSKTSTMEKEMRQAAAQGFEYRGQTVFQSAFGGREVTIIMERAAGASTPRFDYRLLATSRTSTMQKELQDAARGGFRLEGLTVAKTAFGGNELVCILSRAAQ
ncbi:MAG: hypothetical protein KIT09_32615 [Bryobacteraceae bacterium]|nr:hypothetical protein [Bryobacteraceae bacterium]